MQKIRKGDKVVVLTGKDKGRTGEVLSVHAEGRQGAVVRGVNLIRRHQKQSQSQEGGIITKEAPIHLSNIALADPKDGKPTRVGFKIEGRQEGARRQALGRSRSMAEHKPSTQPPARSRSTTRPSARRCRSSSATRTRCRSRVSTRSC